ncbi:MAG: hypothetical protein WD077_12715 [Bacteroidia bacterium]
MKILEISHISANETRSIQPELEVAIKYMYDQANEIVDFVSARLGLEAGKNLCDLYVDNNSKNRFMVSGYPDDGKTKTPTEGYFSLRATITPHAMEAIEKYREGRTKKDVIFNIDLNVRLTKTIGNSISNIKVDGLNYSVKKAISQSDWAYGYAPKLGVGRYLLVELPDIRHHENANLPEDWATILNELERQLELAQQSLNMGDWHSVLIHIRSFLEVLKFGDGSKELESDHQKEIIASLFKKDDYDEDAFESWLAACYALFQYVSKYIHNRKLKSNAQRVMPIARREDAMMVYAIAVALFNQILAKQQRSNRI